MKDTITNPRSNEFNTSYDISEWSALGPKVMSVTIHEEFLQDYAFLVHKALSKSDSFSNGGVSIGNGIDPIEPTKRDKINDRSRKYDRVIVPTRLRISGSH